MAHINHFECDECGSRTRRITLHTSEMPGHEEHPAWEDLHFCGTLCLDTFIRHGVNDNDDDPIKDQHEYWLTGQDLRDGA